jgi:hypothetical protein
MRHAGDSCRSVGIGAQRVLKINESLGPAARKKRAQLLQEGCGRSKGELQIAITCKTPGKT